MKKKQKGSSSSPIKKKFSGSSSSSSEEKIVYRVKSTPRVTRYTLISKKVKILNSINIPELISIIASYLNNIDKQNYYIITKAGISTDFTYIFNNGLNEITDIVSKFTNLKRLDMSNCYNINELTLLPVGLTSLNVSSCDEIDDSSLAIISKNLLFLQELILKDCTNISYDGIIELSKLSSLSTLDISCVNFINFTCLFGIANLKTLIVDFYYHSEYSNEEDDEENNKLEYLFQLKLTKLVFTHCSVTKGKGDSFGLMASLTSLDLSDLVNYNDISSYLYNGLSNLTNLTELSLEGNYIDNEEMFAHLPITLTKLNLKDITLSQVEAKSLSRLTNLNTFSIGLHNDISIKYLSTLTNLTNLKLDPANDKTSGIPNRSNLLSLEIHNSHSVDLYNIINLTYLIVDAEEPYNINVLSNCTNLLHLELQIPVIPIKIISTLTFLRELKISSHRTEKRNYKLDLILLNKLTNLELLDVSMCNVFTEKDIKSISKLNLLKIITLPKSSPIGDLQLKYIGKLYNLEELSFCCSDKVSSIGISYLSNLKSLYSLLIYPFEREMPKIEFFDTICTITSLRTLYLSDLSISNTTYKNLPNLTRLRSLQLDNCEYSSKIYKKLDKMSNLINININPIMDNRKLRKLPNLAKMLKVNI